MAKRAEVSSSAASTLISLSGRPGVLTMQKYENTRTFSDTGAENGRWNGRFQRRERDIVIAA
ncbi:hypothetical protein [Brevundimonas sp.]|uniref:hypothetical protein n=1 Tax=Brevundimonas sp. TaxID=1871086 RepID=UPI0025C4E3EE|nr:hypothetical protein [Brevundimonas sp.]